MKQLRSQRCLDSKQQINRLKRFQDTCRCQAYKFPHRMGGGSCPGWDNPPYCGACGQPCNIVHCDSGIGQYEFWGSKGFDSHPYLGSDCCNAELYTTPELRELYDE